MPAPICVFCRLPIQRDRKGRTATREQLQHATRYHHPSPLIGTMICDGCRKRPPTTTSLKRGPTTESSDSSSNLDSSSKRQRTAEILSSLAQPQHVQQQPVVTPPTTTAEPLTATSSDRSVATTATSTSASRDNGAELLSHTTDSTSASSPLIHPYEQALAKSEQAEMATSSDTSSSSSAAVPTQQWKQFHDQLYHHVLSPSSRHKHMTRVVASSSNSNTTTTGRYLHVFDAHTHHDSTTPDTNIIQQLQASNRPHLRSTSKPSSSSTVSSQHLQKALSFDTSYTQEAYGQFSIICPSSPPVVESAVIANDEAYTRLMKAAESASAPTTWATSDRIAQQHNVFMPFINIDSIRNHILKQRIKAVATAVQHQYKSRVAHKHREIECDHVFATPLDGFGIDGVQLYLKSGECVTWLHDELLWCSALNYMLRESIGCALWIAIGLHDLKQVMSVSEMDAIFRRPQEKKDIMKIGALLDTLIKKGVHMEYVIQQPGQCVSSPPGTGAAHLVFADGVLMSQLAWNYSFTMPGAIDCLAFWGGHENKHGHVSLSNGSMATRSVLPLYSMQVNGYDLNLADQVKLYEGFIAGLKQTYPQRRYHVKANPDTRLPHCPKCMFRQDWIRINNQCIHCYYNKHRLQQLM
jgi:hypothetical protein